MRLQNILEPLKERKAIPSNIWTRYCTSSLLSPIVEQFAPPLYGACSPAFKLPVQLASGTCLSGPIFVPAIYTLVNLDPLVTGRRWDCLDQT